MREPRKLVKPVLDVDDQLFDARPEKVDLGVETLLLLRLLLQREAAQVVELLRLLSLHDGRRQVLKRSGMRL